MGKAEKSLIIKLSDWEYEKEFRLILYDFIDKKGQKIIYEFSALKGIIFGVKTLISDKKKIFDVIKKKCKKCGRTEFDFYQAYYSQDTGKIKKNKLYLWKPKF